MYSLFPLFSPEVMFTVTTILQEIFESVCREYSTVKKKSINSRIHSI